ncbi:pumilio homolog 23 isoform X2 [Rhododendron vialii]|nr:pumilio homolog 23 isoform X2 [Rhododendron vialii]
MAGEENSYGKRGRKGSMSRRSSKKHPGFDGHHSVENLSGGVSAKTARASKVSKHQIASGPQPSFIRKQVDPETKKYYSEISNVIEGNEVDLEERSIICGNALEESRGKEVELATDKIISHTFETLLDGCDANHTCEFLRSCAEDFPSIAMDQSGSHVAEAALKSLAYHLDHLQDDKAYSEIEETLAIICKVIVDTPIEIMRNCYGSHVLRTLLCLCKGVSLDSAALHKTKSSTILAQQLNSRPARVEINDSQYLQQGFPDQLKFLVSGMLNCSKEDILTLQTDQCSSLVLQTALKLLVGHEEELLHIIPVLLGCNMENVVEGNVIKITSVQNLLRLMKGTAYSHLMEVIVEVAPETLYKELFTKVFRNSLVQLSYHECGNFVVQALVSHARSQDNIELIWGELGQEFKDLLEKGMAGVVASVIAASQRLHSHEHKCSLALAAAICSTNESPGCIVPRLLFLESYRKCKDKSNWSWPKGLKIPLKMHVMGSLILQLIFKFPSEFIQPYITSIASMETDHVLEASKDSGGQRVIEAFLSSNASAKQKRRLVMKLRGHFGELSLHPSGSFTVEKCFTAGNLSQRELIVSELLAVQSELSKTKHGPPLLRKFDVDWFARRPDQWKLRQASKESAYKEFYTTFGSKETKSSKTNSFLAETPRTSQSENLKVMRKEIESSIASAAAQSSTLQILANENSTTKTRTSGHKRHAERAENKGETFCKAVAGDDIFKSKTKRQKKEKDHGGDENAVEKKKKKRLRKDD